VADRPGPRQGQDRVEGLLLGDVKTKCLIGELDHCRDHEYGGEQRRRHERGVQQPPVVPREVRLQACEHPQDDQAEHAHQVAPVRFGVPFLQVNSVQGVHVGVGERIGRGQHLGPHQVGGLPVVAEHVGRRLTGFVRTSLVEQGGLAGQRFVPAEGVEYRADCRLRSGSRPLRRRSRRLRGRIRPRRHGDLLQILFCLPPILGIAVQVLPPVSRERAIVPGQQDVSDLRIHVVDQEVQPGALLGQRRVPGPEYREPGTHVDEGHRDQHP
jgi:hypothetical protein